MEETGKILSKKGVLGKKEFRKNLGNVAVTQSRQQCMDSYFAKNIMLCYTYWGAFLLWQFETYSVSSSST